MPVEFQIEPDPEMFGRGLGYLGGLWREIRPSLHRGDRFEVGLVVNLRGRGRCSRKMRLSGTRLLPGLRVAERNLSRIGAAQALRRIGAGRWPVALLAWIPLFRGADDPAIISEWRRLAELQTDADVRRVLALALLFAEAVGRADAWRPALEGLNVIESQVVKDWTAAARLEGIKEGRKEGKIEGKIETLLPFLRKLGTVPPELEQAIRAVADPARVDALIAAALSSTTIDDFRRAADL